MYITFIIIASICVAIGLIILFISIFIKCMAFQKPSEKKYAVFWKRFLVGLIDFMFLLPISFLGYFMNIKGLVPLKFFIGLAICMLYISFI